MNSAKIGSSKRIFYAVKNLSKWTLFELNKIIEFSKNKTMACTEDTPIVPCSNIVCLVLSKRTAIVAIKNQRHHFAIVNDISRELSPKENHSCNLVLDYRA
jgi:hypothetical protein